jgi:peptide/nickel transport system substrate-binding protein
VSQAHPPLPATAGNTPAGSRTTRRTLATLAVAALALTGCSSVGNNNNGTGNSQSTSTGSGPAKNGGTLRVALSAEPDKLDPTLSRTLVGRTIFNAICEKLYDTDANLKIVPQLAAALPVLSQGGKVATIKVRQGLKFSDGSTMDAAAVKTSLDRDMTNPQSARGSELSAVQSVTVVDPQTVQINLKTPFAPLSAILADRSGMVMNPKVIKAKGDNFGTAPSCVGPFKFSTRVAQDRIEVVKDPNYYNAKNVHLDKIVYRIIADANIRFANLRSGDADVLDTVATTDVNSLKSNSKLKLLSTDSLGYQGITINEGNTKGVGTKPGKIPGPLASDPRVRQAFELSMDRKALNHVVFNDQFAPACGPISPKSQFSSAAAQTCPPHDAAKAKQLLQQAGVKTPLKVQLIIGNTPDAQRLGEAVRSLAKDGGFDVQLQPVEFASSLDQTDAGKFQMFQIGWSGRVDPDGNITSFVQTQGSQNISGFSNPKLDALLDQARTELDVTKRKDLYGQVVTLLHEQVPLVYLYRQKNLTGVRDNVTGVKVYPDGIIRLGTAGFTK